MKNIKQKSAFTMIELVFVIVIIGILAGVAISRLSATRDDAIIVTCLDESKRFLNDITNYYTTHGYLTNATAMTNLPVVKDSGNGIHRDADMGKGQAVGYKCEGKVSSAYVLNTDKKSGSTYINVYDKALGTVGMGRNIADILKEKGFYKKYTIGGKNITY